MSEYFLGVDFGTTSLKACLFDEKGERVATESVQYSLITEGDFIEFPAEDFFTAFKTVFDKISANYKITALAVDTQGETMLVLDKDGNEISVGDRLGSEPDAIHDEVALKMASEGIRELIRETLTDRERNVIELRYGLIGASSMPQREVAKLLGISRSYVSRIETKAIDKLRAIMRDSEISVKSN